MSAPAVSKYQVHEEVYVAINGVIKHLAVVSVKSVVSDSQKDEYRLAGEPAPFSESDLYPTFGLIAKALKGDYIFKMSGSGGGNLIQKLPHDDMSGIDFAEVNFTSFDFTDRDVRGSNFTDCTLPVSIESKEDFMSSVGKFDDDTLWTDGSPVNEEA